MGLICCLQLPQCFIDTLANVKIVVQWDVGEHLAGLQVQKLERKGLDETIKPTQQ